MFDRECYCDSENRTVLQELHENRRQSNPPQPVQGHRPLHERVETAFEHQCAGCTPIHLRDSLLRANRILIRDGKIADCHLDGSSLGRDHQEQRCYEIKDL